MRFFLFTLGTIASVAACASTSTSAPAPSADAATTGITFPAKVTGGAPVWSPTSTRVELVTSGFSSGTKMFASDRAKLTPAQLSALDAVRTLDVAAEDASDAEVQTLIVHEQDGSATGYRGWAPYGDHKAGTLDVSTLAAFTATFTCIASKSGGYFMFTSRSSLSETAPAPTTAPSALPLDTGCGHGVMFGPGCSDAHATLTIAEEATFELGVVAQRDGAPDGCVGDMSLRVYASDRRAVVAASDPLAATGTCTKLRHTFAPGTYELDVVKMNAKGCGPSAAVLTSEVYVTVERQAMK